MTNKELKSYIKKNKVRQYEVAERMELSESRLSVLFRKPLDEEMQRAVIGAVDEIVRARGAAVKGTNAQPLQTAAEQPVQPAMGNIQPTAAQPPYSGINDLLKSMALPRMSARVYTDNEQVY